MTSTRKAKDSLVTLKVFILNEKEASFVAEGMLQCFPKTERLIEVWRI
jgi:hypothetical protein